MQQADFSFSSPCMYAYRNHRATGVLLLFVAPALFAVQVVLAGAAYMIAHMLNIAVGLTFSGGFLDLFLFGILQGNAKTSWFRIIPVGIIYFILYYVIFTFLIKNVQL